MSIDEPILLKHIDGRWRLDANIVQTIDKELDNRTKLTRHRAKNLKENFLRDANDGRRLFHILTVVAAMLSIALVMYGLYRGQTGQLVYSYASLGMLGGLGFALVSSLGLHRQYQVMLAAGWSCEALVTKIDSQILQIALDKIYGSRAETSIDDIVEMVSN